MVILFLPINQYNLFRKIGIAIIVPIATIINRTNIYDFCDIYELKNTSHQTMI